MIDNTPIKILTIDDEKSIRDAFRNYLEDYDYQVLTAENGGIGLEIFQKEHPHLVLVDLRMPGIDGIEVLAEIKIQSPNTPVIVISGTGVMSDAVDALRLGAWDFLLKPVDDLSVLRHAVEKGLAHHKLIIENQRHQQELESEVTKRTQELEHANIELQQINKRLRSIVETTKHITAFSRFNRFGSWLLEEFGRHMLATGGSLYLLEKEGLRLVHALDPGHAPEFISYPLDVESMLNRAIIDGKPTLVKDKKTLEEFSASGWTGYKDDSLLVFPLPDEDGKTMGILSLHSKTPPPFLEQDREIGAILASYSSEALRASRATEALRASEENLSITLDSIGDGVIATDSNGKITRMNPVAEQLTGWPATDATGKPLEKIFCLIDTEKGNPILDPFNLTQPTDKMLSSPEHSLLVARDGSKCRIAQNAAPIRNKNKNVVGLVLVFRDVTEQFKLEDQLRHARKMEAIGQLAGGVAHDFNNMLAGIIGSADILALKLRNNKKLKAYATMIQDAGSRASELTQKLLDFSHKRTASNSAVDMHRVTSEVTRILERSSDKRIIIKKYLNASSAVIYGDLTQIENAILNLAINARDAMPEGGTITISTTNVNLDQLTCNTFASTLNPGLYIEVIVEDTGIGIKEEDQEKIFEPFFTTKEPGKGTGLGLASVYSTTRSHQGDVRVLSQYGKGTIFKVYLPVEPNAVIEDQQIDEDDLLSGSGCILVVDDEAIIRTMTQAILSDLGYDVILAEDGEEAVKCFRQQKDRIDLVLLDMVMPKLNGRDALKKIKKIKPAVKVLLISGFNRITDSGEDLIPGVSGFIQKPFRRGDLGRTIQQILERNL
jgi:PAS domain S-box-containing protein